MAKLNEEEIQIALEKLAQWMRDGNSIRRTFEFNDFVEAMKFVNRVADLAESAWHHPDIDIRWNKVTLTLSTHSEGGLTVKDFDLAEHIDKTREG